MNAPEQKPHFGVEELMCIGITSMLFRGLYKQLMSKGLADAILWEWTEQDRLRREAIQREREASEWSTIFISG